MSGNKVSDMITNYFHWPGVVKDCINYCKSCTKCQRTSKYMPPKAPTVERPMLSEPFESMAVDLVGPLPKGKGGARFILTTICLVTRWPEAIPLKSITAKSVAEGLWQVFCRTGIPETIMSDQGTQFCSRLVRELCSLSGMQQFWTSPYHPQCNGTIERMHSTLKSILKKADDKKLGWVEQLPFALFTLRQMPNSESGLSPFDLVYGYRVRTPL